MAFGPGFMDYVVEFVAAVRPMPEHVHPVRGIPTALSLVGAGGSLAMANVVYRGIVDYERVVDIVLAHRTRESAQPCWLLSRHAKDCGPEREGRLWAD